MSKYEQLKNAAINPRTNYAQKKANKALSAYEQGAAEMHEELVELLSSIPCIKCGLFTACNMSTKIDAIYDAIKRAKAL